jgi:hypothetical protein
VWNRAQSSAPSSNPSFARRLSETEMDFSFVSFASSTRPENVATDPAATITTTGVTPRF